MLAIGRALMAQPRLLLLDEPSLGLAPLLVQQIFAIIREINAQGTTVVLVEQNARQALRVAQRAYVLETGAVTLSGEADELARDERVRRARISVARNVVGKRRWHRRRFLGGGCRRLPTVRRSRERGPREAAAARRGPRAVRAAARARQRARALGRARRAARARGRRSRC